MKDRSSLTFDPSKLPLLRCPIDGTALKMISGERVRELNMRIASNDADLRDRSDQRVASQIDQVVENQSGNWIYPIRSGVLSLLASDAIKGTAETLSSD